MRHGSNEPAREKHFGATGAVNLAVCPDKPNRCKCGPACAVCGYNQHFAVHAPGYGKTLDDPPWDHVYSPGAPVPATAPRRRAPLANAPSRLSHQEPHDRR